MNPSEEAVLRQQEERFYELIEGGMNSRQARRKMDKENKSVLKRKKRC